MAIHAYMWRAETVPNAMDRGMFHSFDFHLGQRFGHHADKRESKDEGHPNAVEAQDSPAIQTVTCAMSIDGIIKHPG